MFERLLSLLQGWFGGGADALRLPEIDFDQDFEDMGAGGGADERISHALVLPDQNFLTWYRAAEPYTQAFNRVAVVRSPAGNDLNRFRNVTAVEAPNVWLGDDALAHIRRVYPSVVRVDVIRVNTAAQLKQVLQTRIDRNDRFGETIDGGRHIHDRFVLLWPADALPASITTGFNADLGDGRRHEGIDIYAPVGTTIRAPITGVVATIVRQPTALGYGQYVQIGTTFAGLNYLVTVGRLRDISVNVGQTVTAGDIIATSDYNTVKLVVQQPGGGLNGYQLPSVLDPTDMIYWETLRLQPTDNGLRVRERPGTNYRIVETVNTDDRLETMEPHGRTLLKVGQEGRWLNVRTPMGNTGYSAAWFLHAISPELLARVQITGVNLDRMHRLGAPVPQRLGNIGWVRFAYNVSYNPDNNSYGNTDINAAYRRYQPFIQQYAHAGYKVMVVFTHQTFGEGAGYVWPAMDSGKWRELTAKFADMVGRIVKQYAGQDIIHCYQIWNEQDAGPNAGSSVTMAAGQYAYLLGETVRAIRAVDKKTRIITGGHTGGPGNGAAYALQTIKALPPGVTVDGIAFHPYGRGTNPGPPYTIFGHIDESVNAYQKILPGKPLWITEFGVLDRPNDPPDKIADYAMSMVNHLKLKYPGVVETAIWYAWAQGMHNGYGLVGPDDQPRQPLFDRFLGL